MCEEVMRLAPGLTVNNRIRTGNQVCFRPGWMNLVHRPYQSVVLSVLPTCPPPDPPVFGALIPVLGRSQTEPF